MSPSDKGIGSGPRWARRKQAPFRYLLEEDQPTSPSHTRPAAHSRAARPDPRFHISRTTFIAELCFLMMAQGTIDSTRWIFRHGMIKLFAVDVLHPNHANVKHEPKLECKDSR